MSISTASPCNSISSRRAAASPLPISLVSAWVVAVKSQRAVIDPQQAAGVGVEGGFPQLYGAHLAQALEAADGPAAVARAFLAQLVENGLQLALIERIELGRRLLAARGRIDPEQRRLGDVDVAGLDQLGKWRKNSVSSSTWMCEPSTSASLRMQILP